MLQTASGQGTLIQQLDSSDEATPPHIPAATGIRAHRRHASEETVEGQRKEGSEWLLDEKEASTVITLRYINQDRCATQDIHIWYGLQTQTPCKSPWPFPQHYCQLADIPSLGTNARSKDRYLDVSSVMKTKQKSCIISC